jgi:hypothetical protein
MEIGVKELSPKVYSYQTDWNGKPYTNSGWYEMNYVVEQWMNLKFTDNLEPDTFVKQRARTSAPLPLTQRYVQDAIQRSQRVRPVQHVGRAGCAARRRCTHLAT